MRATSHDPSLTHAFEDCGDADCSEAVCVHYRAGLAAGSEFIRDTEAGFARARAAARETSGETAER